MKQLSSALITIFVACVSLSSCKKDASELIQQNKNTEGIVDNKNICCPAEPPTITGGAMNFTPAGPGGTLVHIELLYTNPSDAGSFRTVIRIPDMPNQVFITPVGFADSTTPGTFPLDFMVPSNLNNPNGTFEAKVVGRSANTDCPRSVYNFSYSVMIN